MINISSVGDKIAMATYGAYAGAKFALEAVSDSLRREVAPLGVQVVVVEPGGVRTEMAARGIATANPPGRPDDAGAGRALRQPGPSDQHAHGLGHRSRPDRRRRRPGHRKAVTTRKPRTRYTIGRDAARVTRLARILSDRRLDRVLAANLRRHYPKAATA